MPIPKNWTEASREHVNRHAPTKGGVYELKAFGELVYIGKAQNLRDRLSTHLHRRDPNYYRFEVAGFWKRLSELDREHIGRYGLTDAELPPWNDRDPRG